MKKNYVLSQPRKSDLAIAIKGLCFEMALMVILALPAVAHAQTVSLNPVSQTTGQNQNISIDVNAASVNNLFGVAFHLYFDPTLLRFNNATKGDLLAQDGNNYDLLTAVNPAGRLIFGASRTVISGVGGSGKIATLNFTTLQKDGLSSLTFDRNFLQDPGLNSINADWRGGEVRILSPDTTPPAAPSNLVYRVISDSRLQIDWWASTDDRGPIIYRIFRNGQMIATTGVLSYEDSGLAPATTYLYNVSAVDGAGNVSPDSNTVSATTLFSPDITAPAVPTGLTANPNSDTKIDLDWNASFDPSVSGAITSGLGGYRIYRDGTYVYTSLLRNFQDTGLTPLSGYSYQVSAIDQAGNESAKSVIASATTLAPPDAEAPSTPNNFRTSSITTSRIDLAWDASTDNRAVTGYRLYRDDLYIMTVAGTTYYNAGLSPAEGHTYQVSAVDAAGNESARTAGLRATTLTPPDTTPPSVPAGLTAVAFSESRIDLAWSASIDGSDGPGQVSGLAGYRVFQNNVQIAIVSGSAYQATGLSAATSYTFKIRSFDAAGNESADSAPATAVTRSLADTQPPGVIIVSPTLNPTYTTSSPNIDLAGTALDNVGLASLAWSNDRGGSGAVTGTAAWNVKNISLQPGQNLLTVTVYDQAGNSSSDSLNVTYNPPDVTPPSAPVLSATAVSAWQINLTWTAAVDTAAGGIPASGLGGYRLYRNDVLLATLSGTGYQNTGLIAATAYTYRLTAFDKAGNTVDSNIVTASSKTASDNTAPTAPTSLRAYLANDTQVNLSWSRASDPAGTGVQASGVGSYRVYRNNQLVATIAVNGYNDAGLSPATLYTYNVSAVDNAGNESLRSNSLQISSLSGLERIRPSAPRYLQTVVISHRKARFSWPASADNIGVTGYKVFRNGLEIATVISTVFEDDNLQALTSYAYRVSAFDAAGNNSYQSSALNLRTQATPDTTTPTVPADFKNVYNAYYPWTVRLFWTRSTDDRAGVRYYIYRNNQLIAESRYTSYSENLKETGNYYYSVSAVDWAGNESARSNIINQAYVGDTIAPTLPGSLRIVYNAYYPNQARLYWNRSVDDRSGVIKYRVLKNGAIVSQTTGTGFYEVLTTPGTYYYEIEAVDAAGNLSARSNQLSLTYAADVAAPQVPAGVRVIQDWRTTNIMKINWNRSLDDRAGNIVYNLYRDGAKIATTRYTGYNDRLAGRGSYAYSVSAQDETKNESDRSVVVTITY